MTRAPRYHLAARAIWMRACALLLAIVVAGTQAAALVHVARAAHDQCAEHGEWVDRAAHAHPEDTLADGAPGAGQRPQDRLRSESIASDGHDHHHCDVLSLRRECPTSATVAVEALRDAARFPAFPPPTAAEPLRPVPLLLLAPKNSPPA